MTTKERLGLEDTVDLAGRLSFPASDAPAWSPTHVGAPRPPRPSGPKARRPNGPELLYELVQELRDDIHLISEVVGLKRERTSAALLSGVANTIQTRLGEAGLPVKTRPASGERPGNIEAVILGVDKPAESVVVAARYGSVCPSTVVEHDATGVAVALSLAHVLQEPRLSRTVRIVAFPDRDDAAARGVEQYLADLLREGPRVTALVSLERIGVVWPEATRLPGPLRSMMGGSGLALVGDRGAESMMKRGKSAFERADSGVDICIPMLSRFVPAAWREIRNLRPLSRRNIPAFCAMEVRPLGLSRRSGEDARLDFDRMGRATCAIAEMIRELAGVHAGIPT